MGRAELGGSQGLAYEDEITAQFPGVVPSLGEG